MESEMVNFSVEDRQVTLPARDFVDRYRDIGRMEALCAQCPSYGNVWSCPPFDVDARIFSDGFKTVTLMATIIKFDEETIASCVTPRQAREVSRAAMRMVWKTLLPKLRDMEREVSGSRCFTFRCDLCPEGCSRPNGEPCRHPELMRHSLESVGFDLNAAAADLLDINLEWSANGALSKTITLLTAVMRP